MPTEKSEHIFTPRNVLVAGATGTVGSWVVRHLAEKGHHVTGLSRKKRPGKLPVENWIRADLRNAQKVRRSCKGIDWVISCAGAPVNFNILKERNSSYETQYHGNLNLLNEAFRRGVERFGYVSLYMSKTLKFTDYARAHEKFSLMLTDSGIPYTIIRPTAFFDTIHRLARKSAIYIPGSGIKKTNPVHEADVALSLIEGMEKGIREISIGGPEVFQVKELFETLCAIRNKTPRFINLKSPTAIKMTKALKIINPRVYELTRFSIATGLRTYIAPQTGTQRLRDYEWRGK